MDSYKIVDTQHLQQAVESLTNTVKHLQHRLDHIEGGTQQEQEGPRRPTIRDLIDIHHKFGLGTHVGKSKVGAVMAHYIQSVLDRFEGPGGPPTLTGEERYSLMLQRDLQYYKGDDNG